MELNLKYDTFSIQSMPLDLFKQLSLIMMSRKFVSEMGNYPIYIKRSDVYILCHIDNSIVGFTGFDSSSDDTIVFTYSWVDPNYRHKGIFRTLFELRHQKSNGKKVKAVANTLSKSTFEKFGYTLKTIRGKYFIFER